MEETSYDPWGEIESGGTVSKFLYTGQEYDAETDLNYYGARYYSADMRRFTQPDDIVQNVYNSQTLNRYSYVKNNPLRYTDPTGHISILDYNNALTQYHKDPNILTYNNILNTVSAIQQTKSTAPSGSNNSKSGGSSGGGIYPGYYPKLNTGGTHDVAIPAYNFYIGNDIKTFRNPNASLVQRGWAGIGIIGAVALPETEILKAPKAVEGVVDASKVFNADQAALIDLAKVAKRTGISSKDADTLLKWAEEYNVNPALDHRSPTDALHWDPFETGEGMPHTRIGSQNHIGVK